MALSSTTSPITGHWRMPSHACRSEGGAGSSKLALQFSMQDCAARARIPALFQGDCCRRGAVGAAGSVHGTTILLSGPFEGLNSM